ncbi:MAG: DUF4292 domain-containing protein [Muribaculaceae bacterium]|nr:DUF4292 domain-containing protein [Muribaculaceae bacterium]MBQ7855315.1 DUF4292 domain-containing protein [Muribaculaceae bacterium]
MKQIYIIICLCAVVAMSSCRSSKSATTTPSTTSSSNVNIEEIHSNIMLSSKLDSVGALYHSWNDVELPVDLELISPNEFSVSGRATMVKDKSIYISIRVFGFEAANIYINNDSIHATYKMGKIYIADDVRKLLKGYPVNVGDLQNILLGRAFILGDGTIKSANGISVLSKGATWEASPKCEIDGVNYYFTFNSVDDTLKLLTVLIQGANPVHCYYNNIDNSAAGKVAEELTISANANKQQLKASIKWNLKKAKWNTGATPKWKAPKGYKRVNVEDLLNAINQKG